MFDIFAGLWPIIWKYTASGGAMIALLAVVIYIPGAKAKIAAACAICLLVGLTTSYTVGIRDEHELTIAILEKALAQEIEDGNEARSNAERTIARDTPDSVRNDPCNRDNWRPGQQGC